MKNSSERLILYASGLAALGVGDLSGISVPGFFAFVTQWWQAHKKPDDVNSYFHQSIKSLQEDFDQSPEFKQINWDIIEALLDQLEQIELSSNDIIDLIAKNRGQEEARIVSAYIANRINWTDYRDQEKIVFIVAFKLAYKKALTSPEVKQDRIYAFVKEILATQNKENLARSNEAQQIIDKLNKLLDRRESFHLDRKPIDLIRERTDYLAMTFSERGSDFFGREDEKSRLQEFLADECEIVWWQIAGKAGQGKSRLALHLVDTLDDGTWYAGFLDARQLSETNWFETEFLRPSLIVIDYIASTQKAEAFMDALNALRIRIQENKINHKVRFLLLEREGYRLDQSKSGQMNWLDPLIKKPENQQILEKYVFNKQPLELSDLHDDDMRSIIKSWREKHRKPALSDTELEQIIKQLKGNSTQTRAWRPLFAILFASLSDKSLGKSQDFSIEDILTAVLDEEQSKWDIKEEPNDHSIHIACLATMVGEIDLKKLEENEDIETTLYIGQDNQNEIFRQAHCLLGRNITIAPDHPDYGFSAREPDLIGEYLVIRYLERILNRLGADKEKFYTLIKDAWHYDFNTLQANFPNFLMRLNQDFPTHSVTRKIGRILPPDPVYSEVKDWPEIIWVICGLSGIIRQQQEIDQTQIKDILLASAYIGNNDIIHIMFEKNISPDLTDEETGLFPLLLAAQNGHTDCVRLLLEKGANPDQINEQDGTFPLLMAAQQGHTDCVRLLLDKGANADQANEQNGTFPLLMAAQNGHTDCVRLLLEKGANPDQINEQDGTFPLLLAAQNGHTESVRLLLDQGGNPDQFDKQDGTFPLLMAAQQGHTECVRLLLDQGANPDQVNEKNGNFPLLMATGNGHTECVGLLLEKGATFDQAHKERGIFPLLLAAQNGHTDCVRLLLEKGANPDQLNEKSGAFPLLLAAQNGHTECVGLLLEKGATFDQAHKERGIFPLLQAAQNGHTDCVRLLLDKGANADQANEQNGTFPLLMAVQNGHTECVGLLLEKGATFDQAHKEDGVFPLLLAAQNGHTDCVRLLLDKGANPDQLNEKSGAFPLLLAAQNGHTECVGLLLEKGATFDQAHKERGIFPLLQAAQNGHTDCVRLLLDKGANADQANEQNGTFPLLMAAQNGHTDCVRLLLEKGATLDQAHKEDGVFPLLLAAQNGHTDCVRLLLDKGANPDQVNEQNGTFPLLQAAQNGHTECVRLLLDKGANSDQVSEKSGNFPLLQAAQNGHTDCVRLLLEKGATLDQAHKEDGVFPLLLAAQNGHTECVGLLLDKGANSDQANEQNGTFPLLMASHNNHADVIQLLLQYNATPDKAHPVLGTALDAAKILGHQEIIDLLEKALAGRG